MKSLRVRPRADAEIDSLADFIARDNLNAALEFFDAVQKTFTIISEQPSIGSNRYSHIEMLEDLRVLPVSGFENYQLFYIVRADYVDILRVLHTARDIPAILLEK